MHTPVLLNQTLAAMQVYSGGRYIDATLGEGGHTAAILDKGGHVLAIDRDKGQVAVQARRFTSKNCTCIEGNFCDIATLANDHHFTPVDGVLFDLGLSYGQIKDAGKGLSFKNGDEQLDMRLDETADRTAEMILFQYTRQDLIDIFMQNAEELYSVQIADAIVEQRIGKKRLTVAWLVHLIEEVVGAHARPSITKIFQALRIEVNDEFNNLRKGLAGAISILKPTGLVAVISFHSLEDRIVKQFIATKGYTQTTKKPILGDKTLSFERSATLRVFHP